MKRDYIFTLKNINTNKIHSTYGFESETIQPLENNQESARTTKLVELNNERCTPDAISFLDESKRSHVCYVAMIDFTSKMNVNLLRYHCFWDRHPFDTKPIGCPIRYVPNKAVKTYYSQISRDIYTIKENISQSRLDLVDDETEIQKGGYYETDGVFCSFNCVDAFRLDNKHNPLYKYSGILLNKAYTEMTGEKDFVINTAPHWRILEPYGGHTNIIKFREGFNKIDYECHGNTRPIPKFVSIGTMYEEKLKF